MIILFNLVLIAIMLAFTGTLSFHEVFRNRDLYEKGNDNTNSAKWHRLKWFFQSCFFAVVALVNWSLAILGYALFWLAHDVIGNKYTFPFAKRSIFYMGRWNDSDQWITWFFTRKWVAKLIKNPPSPGVLLFISKLLIVAASLYLAVKMQAFNHLYLLSFPAE